MLTFLHISDTHISADPNVGAHSLFDAAPHPNRGAAALVEAIRQLTFQVDFILHTGDVCANPLEENYQSALDLLLKLEQPLFLLPGNHDSADLMHEILSDGERRRVLARRPRITIMGYHLLTIDSSEAEDPLAPTLPENQIERFAAFISKTGDDPVLVAAHYPFLKTGVPWIDDGARIQNGERIHEILVAASRSPRWRVFWAYPSIGEQCPRWHNLHLLSIVVVKLRRLSRHARCRSGSGFAWWFQPGDDPGKPHFHSTLQFVRKRQMKRMWQV